VETEDDEEFGPILIMKLSANGREPVEIDRMYEGVLIMKYDRVVLNIEWIDNTHVMIDEHIVDISEFIE
jgi:hypothetical protein